MKTTRGVPMRLYRGSAALCRRVRPSGCVPKIDAMAASDRPYAVNSTGWYAGAPQRRRPPSISNGPSSEGIKGLGKTPTNRTGWSDGINSSALGDSTSALGSALGPTYQPITMWRPPSVYVPLIRD